MFFPAIHLGHFRPFIIQNHFLPFSQFMVCFTTILYFFEYLCIRESKYRRFLHFSGRKLCGISARLRSLGNRWPCRPFCQAKMAFPSVHLDWHVHAPFNGGLGTTSVEFLLLSQNKKIDFHIVVAAPFCSIYKPRSSIVLS